MNEQAIEIEFMIEAGNDAGPVIGCYVRGHVPLEQVVEVARNEYERELRLEQGRHAYARIVPYNLGDGKRAPVFIWTSKPGRGAFPVTVFEW